MTVRIWRVRVGRVNLFLLDTNLDANRPDDRDITDQLYGGDLEMRLKQEILLGIGGHRALEALGFTPTVYHMNEGHSSFLAVEWVRRLMEKQKLSLCRGARRGIGGPDLHHAHARAGRPRLLPAGLAGSLPRRTTSAVWD